MWTRSLAFLALAATCAGCLVKETVSDVYLESDGSVTWTVVERNVRSDASAREDRSREEGEFLEAARRGLHPTRGALEALWPTSVDSVVLRDRRPFAVATTARFLGPDTLARELLDRLDIPGEAVLERTADTHRLRITVDLRAAGASDGETEVDAALDALVDALAELRIFLPAGRFVDVAGFRVEREDFVVLDHDTVEALVEDAGDELVLWIEWTRAERDATVCGPR